MNAIIRITIAALIALFVMGCTVPTEGNDRYRVIYRSNNAESGAVPIDTRLYGSGEIVTVRDNEGDLVRTGFPFFIGWNTRADGSGSEYNPGDRVELRDDLVLYARWIDASKLTASGEEAAAGDGFGSAVAIHGNYAVVGVNADDDDGHMSGSVYFFRREGTSWVQDGPELNAGVHAAEMGRFGYSVALHGNLAIVGSIEENLACLSSSWAKKIRVKQGRNR